MTPLAERLANETLALCRIPSPIGQEQSLCDHLERLARLAQWPVRREGNALVIEGARPLALVGHLDTVPAFPGDGEPRIENGRVYGKGASDMKGGLAVALALLRDLPPERRPHVILYDREEGPYAENGLEPLLAKKLLPSLSLAVCLEPTSNALQLGCVGSLHATVRFRGRSAHSARPWEGENAIHKAGRLLAKLASTERRPVRNGDLTYYEVAQVTRAEGGRARNVVPDLFELNLNYRFAPGTSIEEAKSRLADLVEDGELEFTDLSPSGPSCAANPDLQRLQGMGVPGRGQAGLDGCGALRGARHRRRELRTGKPGPGAPGRRVVRDPRPGPGLRAAAEMAPRLSRAYVALGSNLGDSRAVIARAMVALGRFGTLALQSSVYRTPPMGPPQPWYLNAAAAIDSALAPEELLVALKELERELGRGPGERWGPRLIDLDLLLVDGLVVKTDRLTLPHPDLHLRPFVLVPLAEIAPELQHPVLRRTMAELRDTLPAEALAAIERLDSGAIGR